LLSDITNMLQNLEFQRGQSGNGMAGMPGEPSEGEEPEDLPQEEQEMTDAMRRLSEILREQRQLNDDTLAQQRGEMPSGQQGQSGQDSGQESGQQQGGQQGQQPGEQAGQGGQGEAPIRRKAMVRKAVTGRAASVRERTVLPARMKAVRPSPAEPSRNARPASASWSSNSPASAASGKGLVRKMR
jgi:hypothetical protein